MRSDERHDGTIERDGHVERSGVQRDDERRAVEDGHRLTKREAERRRDPSSDARLDRARRRQLGGAASADEHGQQAELHGQGVGELGPAFRDPVLVRSAAADDECRERAVELRAKLALPLALVGPRPEVPLHGLVRHADGRQELEVLILHVLRRMRRNAVRREEPVEIARTRVVEAELHGRVDERRDDPGLEVGLEREHDVEASTGHGAPEVAKRPPPRLSLEGDDLVHGMVSAHQRGGAPLEHPADVGGRMMALERGDDRQHVHGVAERAHHHDADAVERHVEPGGRSERGHQSGVAGGWKDGRADASRAIARRVTVRAPW